MPSVPEIIERASGGKKKIKNEKPQTFVAAQYVYRRLGFNCTDMTFNYTLKSKPVKQGDAGFGDIVAFARGILSGAIQPPNDEVTELKPLDITISKHSYIIIELPPGWEYGGAGDKPEDKHGLNLGHYPDKMPDEAAYGELRYITPTDLKEDPIPGCRMIFFKAINREGSRESPYLQPLNFNLFLPDGLAVIVDPDIRFPGQGSS